VANPPSRRVVLASKASGSGRRNCAHNGHLKPRISLSPLLLSPAHPFHKKFHAGHSSPCLPTVVERVSFPFPTPLLRLFIYDLAEQLGFGPLTKSWFQFRPKHYSVVSLKQVVEQARVLGATSLGKPKIHLHGPFACILDTMGLVRDDPSLVHSPPSYPQQADDFSDSPTSLLP